uniref:Peroxisomal membrane protein PEX14 n=1 Tax=Trypanosoma congolense (strain IL3000) TaxID=1068625 RepID=G0UV37_TRYCI|nr:putative peroxin 14 [Trypanosoma congolense IL3000]
MSGLLSGSVHELKPNSEMGHEPQKKAQRIANAVEFLLDPRVKNASTANKVRFLKSKNLSAEEICEAFVKCGQPKSLEEIKMLVNNQPYASALPTSQNTSLPVGEDVGTSETSHSRHAGAPLYVPQVPPLPEAQSLGRTMDWRDYVIAVGTALAGSFAAFKAFQTYSPYEFRLKEEKEKPRRRRSRNRRHISSDSDTERAHERRAASALPNPLPSVPTETKSVDKDAELERLKTELKETQEALEAEKKSKAELSITLGKLRGQVNAYSRANEKQEEKIKSLQEELTKLKTEAEKRDESSRVVDGEINDKPPSLGGSFHAENEKGLSGNLNELSGEVAEETAQNLGTADPSNGEKEPLLGDEV